MKPTLDIGQSAHLIDLGVDPKLASKCVLYFCDEYDEPLASWDRYEENGKVFCATEEAYGRSVESRIVSMDADFDQSAKEENPIFDLSDILNILPKEIYCNPLRIETTKEGWYVGYVEYGLTNCDDTVVHEIKGEKSSTELIDALYSLLKWCLEIGYMTDYHKVKIRCPECGSIEDAKVEHTFPFWTFIHFCGNCGYVIMESEWEEVEPKTEEK